ncbi:MULTISPECIES: SRPBCC domain-containing protein [Vibrio]|uniref:Activator of Hsp90 ATPase homologue 1/2-like C-terminal domain-containing protein n=1 Tax=Vibrio proteolyticus NBRC 13287 TaxID=1219065 RepID=U3B6R9_VIBPR|nr:MULTISPECIES: SRPBCC domain-containing protein [Vibrio]NAW57120.1 ATPase [Vibrio sp. V36_P2S2PM302]NAX24585.1 ATPase [Vibrio sp. V38_P2S17PM301]NAX28700.1 ATPase [Vibrio sp. V37_P2S8PM304]GAD65549.1 hypothetical protein VPR01S_01_03220 [Vibrio proteolyticus NBRC 13287]
MIITVSALIEKDVDTVWKAWNTPESILKWNAASSDWHTTESDVDLRVGGRFRHRMEAKDGSMGFDFTGTYQVVELNRLIEFEMDDKRKVVVRFESLNGQTQVTEEFEAEQTFTPEQQQTGWQNILNGFKEYVEQHL